MDRGIPTEAVLEEMRRADPRVNYLVGTPKGRLSRYEQALLAKPWHEARPGVRVNTTDRPLKSVRVVFEARIVGGELRHEIGGTTDEARWFDPGAISDLPRVSLVDIALGMAH